jgi:hypothetical protein
MADGYPNFIVFPAEAEIPGSSLLASSLRKQGSRIYIFLDSRLRGNDKRKDSGIKQYAFSYCFLSLL